MHRFLPLAILALAGVALGGESDREYRRLSNEGVAIDDYSPVSYFERGSAEHGDPQFTATHEGAIYWFTDADQVAIFEESPNSYVPAHGGWCSLMLSGSGNRTPANPETWKIVDGQLLMFWSGSYKGMDINGLSNWESKTKSSEKKELKRLADANKTWAKIQSGKKNSPIVLFNERDQGLIADDQRQFIKQN